MSALQSAGATGTATVIRVSVLGRIGMASRAVCFDGLMVRSVANTVQHVFRRRVPAKIDQSVVRRSGVGTMAALLTRLGHSVERHQYQPMHSMLASRIARQGDGQMSVLSNVKPQHLPFQVSYPSIGVFNASIYRTHTTKVRDLIATLKSWYRKPAFVHTNNVSSARTHYSNYLP